MSSSTSEFAQSWYRAIPRGPFVREIPRTERSDMRVPARIYADDHLWSRIVQDRSLDQLVNVATLPGVRRAVYAMPDVHEGYGFPVGGVAATDATDGVISPGGVGYDINCGVRLLATDVEASDLGNRVEPLIHDLSRSIPSGTGRGGALALTTTEIDRVLAEGCRFLAERGLAVADDLETTESGGSLKSADPVLVSPRARERGRNQVGSIGSGNHFVELGTVDRIFDVEAASVLGLHTGQITVLIHTGSRGLGHQVCTDFVRRMDEAMRRSNITIPDRQLACAPFASAEGRAYFAAMCAAANFAWSNRQMITHLIRRVFGRILGPAAKLGVVYDVAHNMAKLEEHGGDLVCVHRKGATRAFGPSHPETPTRYRTIGQPLFIPGSMGTASYILVGTDEAMRLSFGSACHGAGRAMSRGAAKRFKPGHVVREELAAQHIIVRCPSTQELAEEAPHAYKDVERVVDVVHRVGLARKVARLRPLGVIKG